MGESCLIVLSDLPIILQYWEDSRKSPLAKTPSGFFVSSFIGFMSWCVWLMEKSDGY